MDDINLIANVAKATRPELMEGYRALLKKYKDLVGQSAGESEQKPNLEKIEKYKTEGDISVTIGGLRVTLQNALAEIENKLEEKFEELKKFDEAILLRDRVLKERFEIESAAGSLLALLQAKDEAKRLAESEKIELEQKRKRDEEEYKFNLELQKRKDKEAFEAEKRAQEVEINQADAKLLERQKVFAAKETEFVSLQKQVAEFAAKLEEEKRALENRVRDELKREKDTAILLLQKDSEAQKIVLEGKVKTLESSIDEQKRLAAALQDQLKASQTQIQEVVLKSIEGASGAKTLDVVNKLALEQTRAGGQRPNFNR